VTRADCHYFAYSDCGIFGNYFYGNEIFTRHMNYCGVHLPTVYAHYLNDVEVIRGKASLFNDLLINESPEGINNEIGHQLMHVGRRVPRAEFAKRIANLDSHMIKGVANKYFYDSEPTFTNWGPIESVSHMGSYKYFKINTIVTVTNAHHTLFG